MAENDLGRALRATYVFRIVPMHNADGVALGNYRTNASSINLENQWLFELNAKPPIPLRGDAPAENQLLNTKGMYPLLLDQQTPVVLALNLHSSNSEPDTAAFLFPHFGSDPKQYTEAERNLWAKQINLIKLLALRYGGRIEMPPPDAGRGFLKSYFPETWWWKNQRDAVNAITLETTYGRAGFNHWITQDDLRDLGRALAEAIYDMAPVNQAATTSNVVTNAIKNRFSAPMDGRESVFNEQNVFRAPFKPEIYENEQDK